MNATTWRWVLPIAVVVLVAFALVILREPDLSEGVKVGIVLPATGKFGKSGELQRRGYEMALEAINSAGGVKGVKMELAYRDDESKPEIAMSAGESLAADLNVIAMVGSYSSGCTLPLAQVAAQHKLPLLVCNASEEAITKGGNDWVFRMNATSETYVSTILQMAREVADIKTVAILYVKSSWGEGIFRQALHYCNEKNIDVTYSSGYDADEVDFSAYMTRIKSLSPEAILMFSYEVDAVALMRTASQLEVKPKVFLGGGAGFATPSFISDLGRISECVLSVAQWTPDVKWPGAPSFNTEYLKRFGVDAEYHPAAAYAALKVLATAMDRPSVLSRDTLAKFLRQGSFDTIYGPVKFENYDGFTNQNKHPMLIIQVQGQRYVTVYPRELAQEEVVFSFPGWSQ